MKTPVLFIVFNRPDTTAKVFESIRRAKPTNLYIASDGPRPGRNGESEKVEEARRVATAVDWPANVKTLFQNHNLGCKSAVSGAISWLFEQENTGVILEDDCLPHPDFFRFCEELLSRYGEDDRVSVITGNNFQNGRTRGTASYYFSKYNHCWGWATWRRAWKLYQGDLSFWPTWKNSSDWRHKLPDPIERWYWSRIFDKVRAGKIDTWDYPWTASVWFRGGLTATPNVNLVSNIGFGPDATHTFALNSPLAAIKTNPIGKLSHPNEVIHDNAADRFVFDSAFGGKHYRFPNSLLRIGKSIKNATFKLFNNSSII